MPHIEITYKRNVSESIVALVIDAFFTEDREQMPIPTEGLDVYARRTGKLDRQQQLIMVRYYADPYGDIRSHSDRDRVQDAIWSKLSERVRPDQIGVEVVVTPAAS